MAERYASRYAMQLVSRTTEKPDLATMIYRRTSLASLLLILTALPSLANAGWREDLAEYWQKNMIDAEDGKFDISEYLGSARGFFPVPIIITEPAVGFGIGAAVAYFHPPKEIDHDVHPHNGPPSISVVLGAGTENGTRLGGLAHMGVWRDDHIRYTGAVAAMDINMTFYPDLGLGRPRDGIGFNVEGQMLYQEMQFRLGESNWWLGGDYLYVDAKNRFDLGGGPIELPGPLSDFTQGALGAYVEFDGRNSIFTPTQGMLAKVEYRDYSETWGGDFDYEHILTEIKHFTPFGDYSSLGVRLEYETVTGDVPFFAYPFVSLRGIPALRYQGETALTAELEYLWGFTPRWSAAIFAGAGNTTSIDAFGLTDETVVAGGVGFRYRIARKLGMQVGLDVARGPEETAYYLTVGNAW